MNLLSIIGITVSLVYSVFLYHLLDGNPSQIFEMKLNEVGDFLAGSVGPLAFFWLILGFFQQRIELKQNTTALELQAKELNDSVKQQKELVEISRNAFETEKKLFCSNVKGKLH